jgi:hypothetical protein
MSSSYLLNLKINQLQQEVQGIGESIGYFFNVSSSNGLTVTGNETAFNISAPSGNDGMWGSSDVARGAPWVTTASVQANSVMWYGVSTDITQSFPTPSVPSMSMCNYGLLPDTNPGPIGNVYSITDGQISPSPISTVTAGDVLSISYDGTTVTYKKNNINIGTVSVPTLTPVSLVCGSYEGGQLNSITWSGTGSSGGGGSSSDLQDVLAVGNNAGNQDILNARNIFLNDYLNIGNAVSNTSQIHMCWDTGVTSGGNIQLIAENDGADNSKLFVQEYKSNALVGNLLTLTNSVAEFSGEVNASSYTIGSSSANVLDTVTNPPVLLTSGSLNGFTSKPVQIGSSTSILRLDLGKPNYGLSTLNMDIFNFTASVSPASTESITCQLFITNVQDQSYVAGQPFNVIYTGKQNVNPNGGTAFFQIGNPVTLSRGGGSNGQYVYLGIRFVSDDINHTVTLNNGNISYKMISQPSVYSSIAPSVILT